MQFTDFRNQLQGNINFDKSLSNVSARKLEKLYYLVKNTQPKPVPVRMAVSHEQDPALLRKQQLDAKYRQDDETWEGIKDIGQTAVDFGVMAPTAMAASFGRNAAGAGAGLATYMNGGDIYDVADAYTEASDSTNQQIREASQHIFGEQSQVSEALGKEVFDPVGDYISKKVGGGKFGERFKEAAMDTGMLVGFGKKAGRTTKYVKDASGNIVPVEVAGPSKAVDITTKGAAIAAVPLVMSNLDKLSDDELGLIQQQAEKFDPTALGVAGAIKYINYSKTGGPVETAVKATPQELYSMLKDAQRENPKAGLRYIQGSDSKSISAARASDVTHSQLADKAFDWKDDDSLEGGKIFSNSDVAKLFDTEKEVRDTGHKFELDMLKKYDAASISDAFSKMTPEDKATTKEYIQGKNKKPSNIYEWAAITGLSAEAIRQMLNDEDGEKKLMAMAGSIMSQKGNYRNTVSKSPSFVGREIAKPKALPSDAALRAQDGIKKQILNSKLVPPGFPVRMTNVGELLNIAENGKLREGIAHEGNPGISAQVIPRNVDNPPIQSYGGNSLRSVAVIFPKDAVVNKGVNPNEVKINPNFDPNKARYLVSGYKRALTLTEVKSLIKKGLLSE